MSDWVERTRLGDFAGAEASIAQTAVNQIEVERVQREMRAAIDAQPHAEFYAAQAVLATQDQFTKGELANADQAIAAFHKNLDAAGQRFNENVRPQSSGNSETRSYFASRQLDNRVAHGLADAGEMAQWERNHPEKKRPQQQ